MRILRTVSKRNLAVVLVVAAACFLAGYAFASRSAAEDPSTEFSLRYESDGASFYELSWADGFMWMIDSDRDGVLDQWIYTKNTEGSVYDLEFKLKDRNADHKLDEWYKRIDRNNAVLAKDNDYDGVVDEIQKVVVVRKYKPSNDK